MSLEIGDMVQVNLPSHHSHGRILRVSGKIANYVYILTDLSTGERLGYGQSSLIKIELGRIIKII